MKLIQERIWKKSIEGPIIDKFHKAMAIDDPENEEEITNSINALVDLLKEILRIDPEFEDTYNDILDEISMLGTPDSFEDTEDETAYEQWVENFNYILSMMYDYCDANSIWIDPDKLQEDYQSNKWNKNELINTRLLYVLDDIENLNHEINDGSKGSYSNATTYKELGRYIKTLTQRLGNAGEKVYELDQYYNESIKLTEDDREGWDAESIEDVSGLMTTLDDIYDLAYELKNTIKGAYSGAETYNALGSYIKKLAKELDSCGNAIMLMDESISESKQVMKESTWAVDEIYFTPATEKKLDFIYQNDKDKYEEMEDEIYEATDDIIEKVFTDSYRVQNNILRDPDSYINAEDRKKAIRTMYSIINKYYKNMLKNNVTEDFDSDLEFARERINVWLEGHPTQIVDMNFDKWRELVANEILDKEVDELTLPEEKIINDIWENAQEDDKGNASIYKEEFRVWGDEEIENNNALSSVAKAISNFLDDNNIGCDYINFDTHDFGNQVLIVHPDSDVEEVAEMIQDEFGFPFRIKHDTIYLDVTEEYEDEYGDIKTRVTKRYHESLDSEVTLQELADKIDYNGADYRGAEIPKAIDYMINQINIPDNMRLKWFDVDVVSDDVIQLTYITQEPFSPTDSNSFIKEVTNMINVLANKYRYDKPFTLALDVTARDGRDEGQLVYDIKVNADTDMSL